MNWKRCFVMTCSLTLVGCGSAADTSMPAASTSGAAAVTADANLVTLDLPGMT